LPHVLAGPPTAVTKIGAEHRKRFSPCPFATARGKSREWRAKPRALDGAQSAEGLVNKW